MKTRNYLLALTIAIIAWMPTTAQTWLEKSMNGSTLGSTPPSSGSPDVWSEPLDTAWRLGNVGIGLPGWPETKLHVGHNTDVTSGMNTFLGNFGIAPTDISAIHMNGGLSGSSFTVGSLGYGSESSDVDDLTIGAMGASVGDGQSQLMGMLAIAVGDDHADAITGILGNVIGDGNPETYGVHGKAVGTNNTVGFNYGVHGSASGDSESDNVGVHGQAMEVADTNIGVWGYACNANWNAGVYGVACNTGTNTDWAGYFAGDVYIVGTGLSTGGQFTPSDKKLKDNINDYANGLAQVRKLPVKTYTFKREYAYMSLPTGNQTGILAQDLEKEFPALIRNTKYGDKENEKIDFKMVNYEGLVPVLVSAIQELDKKVAALEEKLNDDKTNGGVTSNSSFSSLGNSAEAPSMKLMPNPTNDFMNIAVGYPKCNTCSLVITDLQGKLIKNITLSSDGKYTVYKSEIGQGVYLCNLVIDGKYVKAERMVFL